MIHLMFLEQHLEVHSDATQRHHHTKNPKRPLISQVVVEVDCVCHVPEVAGTEGRVRWA